MTSGRPRQLPTNNISSDVAPRKRTVVVSPFLHTAAAPDPKALTLLPNRQAARSLGVPYRHLEQQAIRVVQENDMQVARRLSAVRLLEAAVRRVAPKHDPAGLARSVEQALRGLLRAGADLKALAAHPQSRIARVGLIGLEYLRALREQALVDEAEVLWRASELEPDQQVVHLSGYPRLPAAERNFLHVLAADGSTVHLPLAAGDLFGENRAACDDFVGAGWAVIDFSEWQEESGTDQVPGFGRTGARLAEVWLQGETSSSGPAPVEAYAYPDLESEARGVLATVKELLLAGTNPERIALVARNEEAYGPVLLSVAREFGVPIRALYTIPLSQTRLGHWISSLLATLRDDLPFEETARVLAHPLAAALDSDSWSEARSVGAAGWESWSHYLPALAGSWPTTAQARSERLALRTHVDRLLELLRRMEVRERALTWPREAAAYQVLTDEIRLLRSEKRMDFEGFVGEVEEIVSVLTVPAQPGRGGVELHTPLSLFGASVGHLFVLGAYDGNMPKPIASDPLLDPFELEELRAAGHPVEGVEAAARREDLSFWSLLHAAGERVSISHPRLLGRGETLPSPYLERLGVAPVEAPDRPACSLPEARRALLAGEGGPEDPVLNGSRAAFAVELRRESDEPPDVHDGVTGISYRPSPHGTGVSRLIELARCPFKFFAGSVLGLGAPEEAASELEPGLRGRLYHDVLELALSAAAEAPVAASSHDFGEGERLRAGALAALRSSFDEAEEALGLVVLRSWPLEREDHLSTLRRAIESAEFIEPGARVRNLESSFSANWRGIPVRGRVDRIDETNDGLFLIDYKTGGRVYNLAKSSSGRPAVDLQLRIYQEAAAGVLAPETEVAGTRYFSINSARNIPVKEPAEDELERIATEIGAAWRDGSFPVDPDLDGSACTYCDFDALCRKGPRLERKRNRL